MHMWAINFGYKGKGIKRVLVLTDDNNILVNA